MGFQFRIPYATEQGICLVEQGIFWGNRENQFVEQGRPVLYACTGCAANRSIDPDNGVPVGGWGSRRDYSPSRKFSLAAEQPQCNHQCIVETLEFGGVEGPNELSQLRLPALVHESELARNEPDSQVHHLPRAYDDGLPSSAIRLRM